MFLILFFLLHLILISNGQIAIQAGPGYEISSRGVMTGMMDEDTAYCYILRLQEESFMEINGRNSFVEVFSSQLRHIKTIPLNTDTIGDIKNLTVKGFHTYNHNFYLFTEEVNYSNRSSLSYLLIFDREGNLLKKPVLLGEVNNIEIPGKVQMNSSLPEYYYFKKIGTDTVPLFFFYQKFPSDNQSFTRLSLKLLDTGGNILDEKEMILETYPEFTEFTDVLFYNNEVFFILIYSPPLDVPVHKMINHNFSNEKTSYYDFKLLNREIIRIVSGQTRTGNIYIAGLYRDPDEKEEHQMGLFYFVFDDRNRDLLSQGTVPLPELPVKNSAYMIKNLALKEVYITDQRTIILLSEINHRELMRIVDSEGKIYFKPYYHSNDILISHFERNGTLRWQQWIHKMQYRDDSKYSSFKSFLTDEHLFLVFNDHPGNAQVFDRKLIKTMKNRFEPFVLSVNLEKGVVKKTSLHDTYREEKFLFVPDDCFESSSNSFVIGIDEKHYRLLKVTFGNEKMYNEW